MRKDQLGGGDTGLFIPSGELSPWAASEGSTDEEDGDWAGASSSVDHGRRVGRQGPSNLHAAGETLPCAAEAVRIRLLERQ